MMTNEQLQVTKKLLKDGYERAGFDIAAEELDGDMILRYPEPGIVDVTLKLTPADVAEYADLLKAKRQFKTEPAPTSMINTRFREQLVIPLAQGINARDFASFVFQPKAESATYVEVGTATPVYSNFFRFTQGYMHLSLDRIFNVSDKNRRLSAKKPIDVRLLFAQPLTIRVYNLQAKNIEDAIQQSDALIDGALFALAYDYQLPLMLADDWYGSQVTRTLENRRNDHQQPTTFVAESGYRRDLLRLYQAGLAGILPHHRFLAFFQILIHFFDDVRRHSTYERLRNVLTRADFEVDTKHLRHLVNLVNLAENGSSARDTSVVLENLLHQHVGSEKIREFLVDSRAEAEESMRSIALRLIATQQAIFANSLIDDATILRDLPLLKFLAEQVILSTKE